MGARVLINGNWYKSVTVVTVAEAGAWHAACAVAMEASSCSCRSGQVLAIGRGLPPFRRGLSAPCKDAAICAFNEYAA